MSIVITAGQLAERRKKFPVRLPLSREDWQKETNLAALAIRLDGKSIPHDASVADWNAAIKTAVTPGPPLGQYEDYLDECGNILRAAFDSLPAAKWLTVADARKSLRESSAGLMLFDLLPLIECRWKVQGDGHHVYFQSNGAASLGDLNPEAELLSIRTTPLYSVGLVGRDLVEFLIEPTHINRGLRRISAPAGVDVRWNGQWVLSDSGIPLKSDYSSLDGSSAENSMQHSSQIAGEWVREPVKCAQTFDGIYLRFINCYPERVPKGNPLYDAGIREMPPTEDLAQLKRECCVLREAYRLAQPRQPKLTVPIETVNNFMEAIETRNRAAVRDVYSEFAGYVYDMLQQLRIDEAELSPAEFVHCLADDLEKSTPSDELPLPGSQVDDELVCQARDRYRRDYSRLAGKHLRELPQAVLVFAVGLWEKVDLPTIEMEGQSLRLVLAKYIQRRDSVQLVGPNLERDSSSATRMKLKCEDNETELELMPTDPEAIDFQDELGNWIHKQWLIDNMYSTKRVSEKCRSRWIARESAGRCKGHRKVFVWNYGDVVKVGMKSR